MHVSFGIYREQGTDLIQFTGMSGAKYCISGNFPAGEYRKLPDKGAGRGGKT